MSGIIEIDFTIFSYLNTSDILKVLNVYFNNIEATRKITLKLKVGNKNKINEIINKFPVIIQCDIIIDININWDSLSRNPNAIHLLEKNLDKINWNCLSSNPNAIHLLENNLDKINWNWLSRNPNAIHLLEKNLDKIDWDWLSLNPNAIHLVGKNIDKI